MPTDNAVVRASVSFFKIDFSRAVANRSNSVFIETFSRIPDSFSSIVSDDSIIKPVFTWRMRDPNILSGVAAKLSLSNQPAVGEEGSTELKSLGLESGQGLGKPTCFILDLKSQTLVIQNGTGTVSLNQWLQLMRINFGVDLDGFIIVNPADLSELLTKPIFKRIKVKIANADVNSLFDVDQLTITAIKRLQELLDAQSLTLEFGNKKGLDHQSSYALINRLKDYVSNKDVEELQVTGADEEKESGHLYNLVTNQVKANIFFEKRKSIAQVPIKDVLDELVRVFTELEHDIVTIYQIKNKD